MSASAGSRELVASTGLPLSMPIGFGSAPADAAGIGFKDVLRILKQRLVTIIVTTVVGYVLVVAATFITLIYFPAYDSEALLELEPPKEIGLVSQNNMNMVNPTMMDQLLRTEARKLKELGLLLNVVKGVMPGTRYYEWYENDASQCAVGLQNDLSTGPIAETRLIRVSLSTRNREESQRIVQALVNEYFKGYRGAEKDELQQKIDSLTNTKTKLTNDLEERRNTIKRFREKLQGSPESSNRASAFQHIGTLRGQLAALEQQRASLQAQIDSLRGLDVSTLPLTAEDEMIIGSDPVLRYYQTQVEGIDIEISALRRFFGEKHRSILSIRERRDGFFEKEVARREELINQVRTRRFEVLRQNLNEVGSMQQRISDLLEAAEVRERELDRDLQELTMMEEERIRMEEEIKRVEGALTETLNAMSDESMATLRKVQDPQLAVEPSRPHLVGWLGGGAVLALAAAVGLAFLRELTDQSIRTPLDVARYAKLPVLGSVPLLEDEEAEGVELMEEAVRRAPHSLVAEAFRKVRTNLQFSGPTESQRVLLVTSPSPSDGKTTIAINLAATMAHGGERVLLIDCNFRKPGIRPRFETSRPEGLSNLLIGQGTLAEYATRTDIATLSILSSGPMPPTPAELLGSPRMRTLIDDALREFDRVILDGPPTLLISDAIVLATQVDGVLLVAQADSNTKGTLKRAKEQLDAINARLVGVVLNGVRARAGGYFREQYRMFYDYTSDELTPAELMGPTTTHAPGETGKS